MALPAGFFLSCLRSVSRAHNGRRAATQSQGVTEKVRHDRSGLSGCTQCNGSVHKEQNFGSGRISTNPGASPRGQLVSFRLDAPAGKYRTAPACARTEKSRTCRTDPAVENLVWQRIELGSVVASNQTESKTSVTDLPGALSRRLTMITVRAQNRNPGRIS